MVVLVFTKDEQGNPWISVAQEGDGDQLFGYLQKIFGMMSQMKA